MQAMDIQEHARKLREARGDLALAQAAQKARELRATRGHKAGGDLAAN